MIDVFYWCCGSSYDMNDCVSVCTTSQAYWEKHECISDGYDEADEKISEAMYNCGWEEIGENCFRKSDETSYLNFDHEEFKQAMAENGINVVYQGFWDDFWQDLRGEDEHNEENEGDFWLT